MSRTGRSPGNGGTTLVEMLIACTLLSMLLLAATGVHVEAREVSALTEEVALRGQIIELASEVLRYHLGLAGHRGVSEEPTDLGGPALSLARGASPGNSDRLTVRYLEERWYRTPELRALAFDVKRDSSGRWNLYQREEGATRQPAVQHLNGLKVTGFVAPNGARLPAGATLPLDAVALELELSFTWDETRNLTIALGGVEQISEEKQ